MVLSFKVVALYSGVHDRIPYPESVPFTSPPIIKITNIRMDKKSSVSRTFLIIIYCFFCYLKWQNIKIKVFP